MGEETEKDKESEIERQYQTVTETANSMKISTDKLRQWIKAGLIEAVKPTGKKFGIVRVSIRSIRDFLDRYTTGGKKDEH